MEDVKGLIAIPGLIGALTGGRLSGCKHDGLSAQERTWYDTEAVRPDTGNAAPGEKP